MSFLRTSGPGQTISFIVAVVGIHLVVLFFKKISLLHWSCGDAIRNSLLLN